MSKTTMTGKITIAISEEIKQQLAEIAEREERNLSWIVRKALQEYIDRVSEKSA